MGSRVLTACSFRSKSIPQQVFHRCRSAEALRLFRVPAVYLTSAFLWFFSVLLFRRINKLRSINPPEGFDSNPDGFLVSDKRHPPTIGWQTPMATKDCIGPGSLCWVCSRKNKSSQHPEDVLIEPCASAVAKCI